MSSELHNYQLQDGTEDESIQCILFRMGNEYYGLPISSVKEIIKPLPITRFPKSPPFVEGVIDLRGHILPIVNLPKMFGLEPLPLNEESRFVDIQMEGLNLGIVVDAVSEVIQIPLKQIEAAPAIVAGVEGKYLNGIARLEDRLILLLDLEQTFGQWRKQGQ
ncbi:chemotaxis protein CheW [Brevibacillus fulvus]|uniref:Purine-binding chemotaxis protein CheW n=1 Tax=Brevibacillus fulvus TaxID=1125967 RepID=A0A938Y216_9BACL|nr:chemotaxis protein CheW [Brevibacillus fulvus]MBM7590954.1 purine-binding chemotaxis protein CheW [Brevibacillus fulvus]